MGFPDHIDEVARLREHDPKTILSNESLLSIMRDYDIRDLVTHRRVLDAYRQRFGGPELPEAHRLPPVETDSPKVMADWLCHRQPDTLGLVLKEIDSGYSREILATAMRIFAQHVATTSRGEIHQYSFDEILLDLLTDARQVAPVAGSAGL